MNLNPNFKNISQMILWLTNQSNKKCPRTCSYILILHYYINNIKGERNGKGTHRPADNGKQLINVSQSVFFFNEWYFFLNIVKRYLNFMSNY